MASKMAKIQELEKAGKLEDIRQEAEDSKALISRIFRSYAETEVDKLYKERLKKNPTEVIEEVTEKVEKVVKGKKKAEKKAEKKAPAKKEPAAKKAETPKKVEEIKDIRKEAPVPYDTVLGAKLEKYPKTGKIGAFQPTDVEGNEQEHNQELYRQVIGKDGEIYKKAWLYAELELAKFGKVEKIPMAGKVRILKGKNHTLVFEFKSHSIYVAADPEMPQKKAPQPTKKTKYLSTLCICQFMVNGFIRKYA